MFIIGLVTGFVEGFIGLFTQLYEDIVGESIVPDMMNAIYNVISTVLQSVTDFVSNKLDFIKDLWRIAGDFLKKNTVDRWNEIKTHVSTSIEAVRENIQTKTDEIKKIWEEKLSGLKDYIRKIWEDPDGIVEVVRRSITSFSTQINTRFRGAVDDANRFLDSLVGGFDSVASAARNAISAIGEFITKAASSALKSAKKVLGFVIGESPSPLAIGLSTATCSITS